MDVQMPEMDGYQATARIRSQERFAGLPIVAMTAHATIEEKQRCLAAGMNDHVAKPIDPAALYDVLGRFHAGKSVPKAAPHVVLPEAPSDALPAVEGLDLAQGLRRVAGNRKLYLSLLQQFLDGQTDAADRIRESLERAERPVAERLAHTVKGTAGNLAAGPVQAAAGALEKAIRDGATVKRLEPLRAELGEALRRLEAALRPWLAAQTPAAPPVPDAAAPSLDAAALKTLVERWARLLSECDASTSDDLEREGGALRTLWAGAEGYTRFARLVTSYDFDGALEALQQAAREKGL
jgi:two-component system sensor histidine kinase/response regulator